MKKAPPKQVVIWKIGGSKGNLTSNEHYENNEGLNLRCTANKNKYLIWKSQPMGINLDWSSTIQNKYHFHLPDGKEREILTGEKFALAIGLGEAFVNYGERDYGINLKWSKKPSYEWVIFDGTGEKNKPIPLNTPLAIVNLKVDNDAGDYLIYMDRPLPGTADIGWTTSPGWGDYFEKVVGSIWDKAKEKIW